MKYYGDYLGFRFGEYHSRDLGLYRVSDGDRYNDVSIPNFTDTTTKITNNDGTYYWDSFYSSRTFTIQCAFDDLSETQLRKIRQIFNGKVEDWLIFDEVPYKKYKVKLQSPPQIKYLTFREGAVFQNGESNFKKLRVHKGEITFQFISYSLYAIDNFKAYDYIDDEIENDYPNIDEWYDSVPLLSKHQLDELNNISSLDSGNTSAHFVYNPGDVATDVKVVIDYYAVPSNLSLKLFHRTKEANKSASSSANDTILAQLNFNGFSVDSGDTRVVIDTATNLVYGVNANNEQTGTLYNKYISSGTFFKIPVTQEPDPLSDELVDYCDYITVNVARSSIVENCKIEYNYLYY